MDTRNWLPALQAENDSLSWEIVIREPLFVHGRYPLEVYLCSEGGIVDQSIGQAFIDVADGDLPAGRTARFTQAGVIIPKVDVSCRPGVPRERCKPPHA